jgi:hypothetical protein
MAGGASLAAQSVPSDAMAAATAGAAVGRAGWRTRLPSDAAVDLAVVAVVALPLAVAFPVATSIGALVLFGLAHTVLELRWVLARFTPVLSGRLLAAAAAAATVIALARLAGAPPQVEIVAGFGLVALGLTRLPARQAAVAAIALAVLLAASLRTPAMYGVALAHLHNVVTAVLLWTWAGPAKRTLRAGLLACYAVVPLLVLAGGADAVLPHAIGHAGPSHLLAAGITPAWATTAMGVRIVAVFAFLQLVHYGVWCWLMPRRAPVADRMSADPTVRIPLIVVGALATGLLAFVFRTDYATGRTLYSSLATYHAYLELPVVLVLLGGSRVAR